MKLSRFSIEQIIAVLKDHEAGMATADMCRHHGISSATFYKCKSKYGGLEVPDARRLRQTVLGACHQYSCCHHAKRWAPKRPKALLMSGRNIVFRPFRLSVSDAKRLHQLEQDNEQLKTMLAKGPAQFITI